MGVVTVVCVKDFFLCVQLVLSHPGGILVHLSSIILTDYLSSIDSYAGHCNLGGTCVLVPTSGVECQTVVFECVRG